VTFGGQVGHLLFATISSAMLARGLGPEQRGIYALALWMPMTLCAFAPLGQAEVNSLYAGLHKDRRSELYVYSLLVAMGMGALGVVLTLSYFLWLPIPLGKFALMPKEVIILSSFLLPLLMLEKMFEGLARGSQFIKQTVIVSNVGFALQALITGILILVFRMGVSAAVGIMIGIRLFAILGFTRVMWQFATLSYSTLTWSFIRSCLRYGLIFMFSSGAMLLINQVVTFVLGYSTISRKEIGLYAVALMLVQQLQMVPTAVSMAFLPRLSNNPGETLHLTPRVFRLTTITCFATMLAMMAFSWLAVLILMGREYLGSVRVIMVMLPGVAMFGSTRVLGSYLWVIRKPQYGLIYNWIVLIVLVAISIPLTSKWGITGAGLANTIAYLLLSAFTIWAYRRESRIGLRHLLAQKDDVYYIVGELRRMLVGLTRRFGIATT